MQKYIKSQRCAGEKEVGRGGDAKENFSKVECI
jgi:hypothetical protein